MNAMVRGKFRQVNPLELLAASRPQGGDFFFEGLEGVVEFTFAAARRRSSLPSKSGADGEVVPLVLRGSRSIVVVFISDKPGDVREDVGPGVPMGVDVPSEVVSSASSSALRAAASAYAASTPPGRELSKLESCLRSVPRRKKTVASIPL